MVALLSKLSYACVLMNCLIFDFLGSSNLCCIGYGDVEIVVFMHLSIELKAGCNVCMSSLLSTSSSTPLLRSYFAKIIVLSQSDKGNSCRGHTLGMTGLLSFLCCLVRAQMRLNQKRASRLELPA